MQGGLAQVVERSIRIRQAPGWRPGYSNWLFFTIIFIANFNASLLCQTEKVEEQKKCTRGISSSGRALDSHSRGTGIDTRILHLVFLYNYFRCQLQHKFFVPNRKGWRIEQICKGDQLKWQSARFAFERHRDHYPDTQLGVSLKLFSLPISTQVCCAKQKRLKNRSNVQGGLAQVVERWIRIREAPGSRHEYSNWLFFTIIFIANFNASLLCQTEKVEEQKQYLQGDQLKWQSAGFAFERHRDRDTDTPIGYCLQLFSLPISTQVCCAKQKRLENRKNVQGGLDQVVERSNRIRQAPGWRPGYSNYFFFTIIFIANFNASLLCQTEKVEEQKQCLRGISSSGRALDSHSRGTGIEAGILQLVILYNYFHCHFQRKFVVPNRKGWRIEQICKGDQLKGQSARFAFEWHRDRDTDTPIGYSLQLFSLPISTQVCFAKQKRLKNRNNIYRGISSSGRALDSHSRGTGIETRILQLVILYNYFHCQFQRKFVVPNRNG